MREIALHLLDIAENSVAAGARSVSISVAEDTQANWLNAAVRDDGKGMDETMVRQVIDPFVTSRTTRKVGLGIPLFKAAAEACGGRLHITSAPGQGARLEASFQHSHIDRMPLGDLAGTLLTLVVAYPHINWTLDYCVDGRSYAFDDAPIKAELGDLPLTEPDVLAFLREYIQQGIASVQNT
jgi:hypothetical protein